MKGLITILCGLCFFGGVAAEPVKMEVFTNAAFPPVGIHAAEALGARVAVYDLDAPDRLEKDLSRGLPGNLEKAKAEAMARFRAIGHDELKRRFMDAYRGHLKAFEYRLERFPAMVFDGGASVVYGVTDVAEALRHYHAHTERLDD